ncbi:MAG: methionine--tRNA ligase [Planctomycetes bacterium]|nr:methionine--tRNA ligase [Planctomycetota bacterium]
MGKILVTAALPYANGRVHLGHLAGAYLPADVYVRWRRLKGDDVVFVCGSDEHGVPITLNAIKRGCSPQEVVDEYHPANGAAFAAAGVQFDIWSRTSSPEHHALSQQFFTRLHEQGFIDKREIQQLYSEQSKMFLPDRYVEGTCPRCGNTDARGDQCDACGGTYEVTELKNPRCALPGDTSKPVLKSTAHWFLLLDKFQKPLEAYVAAHGESSAAPWRLNSLRGSEGWLKMGLRARCITRDTEWGVQIPLGNEDVSGKRLYVWFDAPIGYVTFTQQLFAQRGNPGGWKDYWQNPDCPIYNFIGKDNIPFHCITWPAMQLGANGKVPPGERPYSLATNVVANEFLNFGADKFSKSKGNLIEIGWFVERFGAEALRYYLTAIAPEDNDSTFTWSDFAHRYNGELADVWGNFVHRTLTFTHKYFEGMVPEGAPAGETEAKLRAEVAAARAESAASLDGFRFKAALGRVLDAARAGNRYFDERAPWKQRKDDLAACGTTIRVCLETVAGLALALRPFLPDSSAKILGAFGLDGAAAHKAGSANQDAAALVKPGTALAQPEVPFKKIEEKDLPAEKA